MADESGVYAIKFKNDFIMRVQQMGSRLEKTTRNDPDFLEGKFGYFDRIGPIAGDNLKSTRHGETPINGTNYDRRRLLRDTRNWGDMVDRSDIARMMKNPVSRIVENARMARNRRIDDYVIAAATGAAWSVDSDDNASSTALPAANFLTQNDGHGLTLPKVLTGQESLDHNEVDDEEERWFVYTAHQMTQILQSTPTTNQFFAQIQQIRDGKIDYLAKARWVRSERLLMDPTYATYRMTLMYAKRGLGLATQGEPFTRVTERDDRSYNWQAYLEYEVGATRIEDECVFAIDCLEP